MTILTRTARTIALILGGLVAFAESVDSATNGKAAEWIVGGYYMLRVEIFVFIIIAFALPWMTSTIRDARDAFKLLPATEHTHPHVYRNAVSLLVASLVLALALLSATTSYVVMKVAFVRGYGDFLLNKSFREYRRGHPRRAHLLLASCERVLADARCSSERSTLDERLACADLLRKLHDRLSVFSAQRVEIEDSIVSLDHDIVWHAWQRRRYVEQLARLREQYAGAVDELRAGHKSRAVALLQTLGDVAPGFGSSDDLMRELTSRARVQPLSDRARDVPSKQFVMQLTSWMDPHPLIQDRRAAFVYASKDVVALKPSHDEMALLIGF